MLKCIFNHFVKQANSRILSPLLILDVQECFLTARGVITFNDIKNTTTIYINSSCVLIVAASNS